MKYKHLFFDLDHTLWDFDKNAEETLYELFHKYGLAQLGMPSAGIFIETYTRNNHELWANYHLGHISKQQLRETRFRKTFTELGLSPEIVPSHFEEEYLRICPTKTNLFPQAIEILGYLSGKYHLHIISNGFKESTEIKLSTSGLEPFFKTVVISEIIGVNKPDRAIFEFAVGAAGALKNESLMIGDSIEADIRGAINFGMDAIYFNPGRKEKPADITRQISHLQELMEIL